MYIKDNYKHIQMNNLEKILFLEMTNKQFAKLPDQTYYDTYKRLSEDESDQFTRLSQELHDIWNFINSEPFPGVIDNKGVDTIQDYNDKVAPVNEMIMRISKDFGLTLQEEITDDFKNAIIEFFGLEYYSKKFGKS